MRQSLIRTLLVLSSLPSACLAQSAPATSTQAPPHKLLCYEQTGISLVRPYERGKIPVVFIHGLWLNPCSWHRMIEALAADPVISARFQFWTFGYSTSDPIPYTASLLRSDLDEVHRTLDPDGTDPALGRMIIVGHSMGGLLAKMMAVGSSDRLWRVVSDRPLADLLGDPGDVAIFRSALKFEPRRDVRRVVFIATPHLGSRFDRGVIRQIGTRLVRVPDPLRAAHRRLVADNPPAFFRERFRKGLPSSVDELEWGSPILTGLADLPVAPVIASHSIIAALRDGRDEDRTDGVVAFESAHIEGVASEKVVAGGHLCQDHPDVIAEIRHILAEDPTP